MTVSNDPGRARARTAARVPSCSPRSPGRSRSGPTGRPGSSPARTRRPIAKDYYIRNIHNPSITAYLPPKEKATGAAVVICPGGGHRLLVFKAEGDEPARYLNSLGVAAFALKYRLGRDEKTPYSIQKHAREDGQRAMRLVRSRAKEWNIDPNRIGIMGFSAGGEIAVAGGLQPDPGRSRRVRPDRPAEQPAGLPDHDLSRPARHPRRPPRRRAPGVPARRQRRSRGVAA